MKLVPLGRATASDVTWADGAWLVALGDTPIVQLVRLTPDGTILSRLDFPDGWSYPVVTADFLAYKTTGVLGSRARLRSLLTPTLAYTFDEAGGNFPVALDASRFAWQTASPNYPILSTQLSAPVGPQVTLGLGAPDGIAWISPALALCKDVRSLFPEMRNPQPCGALSTAAFVGEGLSGGMVVRLSGDLGNSRLVLAAGLLCNTPRIACTPDGAQFALTSWGPAGVSVLLASREDLLACPVVGGIPEPSAAPVIVSIGRPLYLGFYAFGATHLPSWASCWLPSAPGGDGLLRTASGPAIAQYVAAESSGTLAGLDIAIAVAAKARPLVPTLAYWPRSLQSGPLPSSTYLALDAYRLATESIPEFESRLLGVLSYIPRSQPVFLVCAVYTSNASLTADLAGLVPVYARLAKDFPCIFGLLLFSAGTRAGGWDTHPDIHPLWDTLASGVPASPPPGPPSPFAHARPYGVSLAMQTYPVYLRRRSGYLGCSPHAMAGKSGDDQYPIYADRPAADGWEEAELHLQPDGTFSVWFVQSNRILSLAPDGTVQSRAADAVGSWESVRAATQPDGISLLYRSGAGTLVGEPLVIEARPGTP